MIKRYCLSCKKVFYAIPHRVKIGGAKFCSQSCASRGNKRCVGHKASDVTRKKMSKSRKNHLNNNWKGGRVFNRGYIWIKSKDGKYLMEHRVVMEAHLGRPLTNKEVVHHVNEKKTDNQIENLQLFKNCGYHLNYHLSLPKPNLNSGSSSVR